MQKTFVLVGAVVVGGGLLLAAPAQAAPSTATQYVPISCTDGSSGVAQVDSRGLPSRSAWIDGRGIAPRAFSRDESGTAVLADGTVVSYAMVSPPSVDAGRMGITVSRSAASLSGTTACSTPTEDFEISLVLSADDTAFLGIDSSYAGTEAHVAGHGATTVYLPTTQLQART